LIRGQIKINLPKDLLPQSHHPVEKNDLLDNTTHADPSKEGAKLTSVGPAGQRVCPCADKNPESGVLDDGLRKSLCPPKVEALPTA
jgi:hypothetical protein